MSEEARIERSVGEAAHRIAEAAHLLFSAGAGIGVDSGLPDFRGNEGFWRAYPPYRARGLSFPSMASARWFDHEPEFGWGFYGHRLQLYRDTEPHPGFAIMRGWAATKRSSFVFTSNVDGQFQRAGFVRARVYEVHGSIHHLQCTTPCHDGVWSADGTDVVVDAETLLARPPLPGCPRCGALARPNVLMFGDAAYLSTREAGQRQRYREWLRELPRGSLVVVEVGAGTAIPTVRYEGEELAHDLGATLVRINVREAHVPAGQIGLPMGGLAGLRAIDEQLPR